MTKKPVGRPKGSKSNYIRKNVQQLSNELIRSQADNLSDSTFHCCSCGKNTDNASLFPKSTNILHVNNHLRMPYCNDCCNGLYTITSKDFPEYHDTYRRVCMILDVYYSDALAEAAFKDSNDGNRVTKYLSLLNNRPQLADKTYTDNVQEDIEKSVSEIYRSVPDVVEYEVTQEMRDDWGFGLDDKSIHFLDLKFKEWSKDVECESVTQKAIIKNICLIQLQIQKAMETEADITKLVNQFNTSLASANMQPKQKSDSEYLTDNQCFGLKIKEWEDEEPISEVDERFKDVDKIKHYYFVWFLGHLCKMIGLRNKYTTALEMEYEEEVSKYTVEPPSYDDGDEDNAKDFDSLFGGGGSI